MPNERENYVGVVKRGVKEEWCGYIGGTLLTQADLSILLNESEIKRNTRHSSDSIARCLKEFDRVAALHHEGI